MDVPPSLARGLDHVANLNGLGVMEALGVGFGAGIIGILEG